MSQQCDMNHRCLLLALVFCAFCSGVSRGQEVLDVTGSVTVQRGRISDVGDALSRAFNIPVCVEESPWFWREGRSGIGKDELAEKRAKGFEIAATNVPLHVLLDQFVQRYTDYAWHYDRPNHVINLFPKDNAPAAGNIENIEIATQSVEAILYTTDMLGLKDQGISFRPGRGNRSWIKQKWITIKKKRLQIRDVLNHICHQLPGYHYWVIRELEEPGVVWGEKGQVVRYSLTFHEYESSVPRLRPPGAVSFDLPNADTP